MGDYTITHVTPSVEDYTPLRAFTGLTPKTIEAATIGLANPLFAVQVVRSSSPNNVVGMGRMIGDGGCFFQVVDIAVLPAHQGKGLGKKIMEELKDWMSKNVPESGTVPLFADDRANELYKQFGLRGDGRLDALQCGNGLPLLKERERHYMLGDYGRSFGLDEVDLSF